MWIVKVSKSKFFLNVVDIMNKKNEKNTKKKLEEKEAKCIYWWSNFIYSIVLAVSFGQIYLQNYIYIKYYYILYLYIYLYEEQNNVYNNKKLNWVFSTRNWLEKVNFIKFKNKF